MHKTSLGGSSSLPIMLEKWSNAINPDYCGSDGTVQVKCTKINSKLIGTNNSTLPHSRATKGNQGAFSYPIQVN